MSQELIERLKKATGPDDRELADAVLLAGGWTAEEVGDGPDRHVFWKSPSGDDDYWDGEQPNPLTSFDAARSLIPAGLFWLVSEGKTRPDEPLGGAQIRAPNDALDIIAEAEHPSAVIALTIAALQARTND